MPHTVGRNVSGALGENPKSCADGLSFTMEARRGVSIEFLRWNETRVFRFASAARQRVAVNGFRSAMVAFRNFNSADNRGLS